MTEAIWGPAAGGHVAADGTPEEIGPRAAATGAPSRALTPPPPVPRCGGGGRRSDTVSGPGAGGHAAAGVFPGGAEEELVEGEVVALGDELPVLIEARVVEQPERGSVPVVQTAVAVATGFVAGAATVALLRRYSGRSPREAEALGESLDQVRRRSRQTTYLVQVRAVERHAE